MYAWNRKSYRRCYFSVACRGVGRSGVTILLDSHVWLWLALGIELDAQTVAVCRGAAERGDLFLSPFSIWELSRKAVAGELELPAAAREWMLTARSQTKVRLAVFDFEIAYDVHDLPTEFHKDPVDRVLASTCRMRRMTLFTRDRLLLGLAEKSSFTVQRA